jgi:dTDP-4-dehydrorhamnose reductase
MTRLLITGASGLLGSHLILEAMDDIEIIAVSHSSVMAGDFLQNVRMDLLQPEATDQLLEQFSPDWVVNCAALTDVDACEQDPGRARALNRDMPEKLARASAARNVKLVHISTDAVFDGKAGNYTEDALPQPVNEYGRSKLEGERMVLSADPHALVLRTNFFGWSPGKKSSLFEWFYRGLKAGELRPGFCDVFVSLLSATYLAELILRLLHTDLKGLYHLASSDCVSKYDFGRLIAEVFSLPADLVQPISVDQAGFLAKRPKNMCLSTRKLARKEGFNLPTVREGVRLLQEATMSGFRDKQQALLL